MVTLEEITYPLIYGWMPLEDVLDTLRSRPVHVHVVQTGRRCPAEIINLADTVTEMAMVSIAPTSSSQRPASCEYYGRHSAKRRFARPSCFATK